MPDNSSLPEAPVLDDAQIKLVQDSFAKVDAIAEDAAAMFYGRLFEIAPDLIPLFKGDMKAQGRKLMTMIKTAVNGLNDLGALVPAVEDLGRRHVGYGVNDADYDTVASALLWTLNKGLGDDFTDETRDAWTTVYTLLARIMTGAGAEVTEEPASEGEETAAVDESTGAGETAAADSDAGDEEQASGGGAGLESTTDTSEDDMLQEVGTLESESSDMYKQMVEDMPVNVLICDLDEFKITYANKASITTLKQLEHVLPAKADTIVGTCINVFHKDPSHQRKLLADPSNLPHTAIIEVGGESLDLLVTAITDADGNYVAPMLTWSVVTEKLKLDSEAARLAQMVEDMPVNVLTCDLEEFKINYANNASLATLKQLEHVLPVNADDIVGTCIDVFHKDPSHQRKLLADPSNLPHTAIIEVGGELLDLLVSPLNDKEGNYIGPMLTWSVVTAKVKADAETAAPVEHGREHAHQRACFCDLERISPSPTSTRPARTPSSTVQDLCCRSPWTTSRAHASTSSTRTRPISAPFSAIPTTCPTTPRSCSANIPWT